MFRHMRRIKQLLTDEEVIKILNEKESGVLATIGDDGYPYQIALNYAYVDGRIIMHGAKEGHKIDAIKANDKVSFCIIDKDDVLNEAYTTLYRNVIVFGRAHIIEDEQEARDAMLAFALKFNPDMASSLATLNESMPATAVIAIEIEHMTGKQSMRLVGASN